MLLLNYNQKTYKGANLMNIIQQVIEKITKDYYEVF